MSNITKWYNQGYADAKAGQPSDPPYQPGNRHYDSYREGFADAQRELDRAAEREASDF